MNINEPFTTEPVLVTDNAVKKVNTLLEEEENSELKLRVFVTGGGCSGFQYGFTFDEIVAEDDAQIDKNGISVVIDSMSYPFLVGSQVDYQEDLQGSKFVVSNPNASSTCGCGSSFAI
jgi:iron-sulfur cluster insertion protein